MAVESILNSVQSDTTLEHAKEIFNGSPHGLLWEPEPSVDGEEDEFARVVSVEYPVGREFGHPQNHALDGERDDFSKRYIRSCPRLGQCRGREVEFPSGVIHCRDTKCDLSHGRRRGVCDRD